MNKTSEYKLGLRNQTLAKQYEICGHFVRSVEALPPERRPHVDLTKLQEQRTKAEVANGRLEDLRGQLRAAVSARREELRKYREVVEYAAMGVSFSVSNDGELLEAGLKLRAPKTPIGLPGEPTELRSRPVEANPTGKVALAWKRPVRRCFFRVEYALDAEGQDGWKFVICTSNTKVTAVGLEPGRTYWFRVAAQNTAGQGPWAYLQVRAAH